MGPPPLSELERQLLKRGLAFYDRFAQQNATAPRAFRQTAWAYFRVGVLQAALGDGAAAVEAYREAIRRFEQLTKDESERTEHFHRLALAYSFLAAVIPDGNAAREALQSSDRNYARAIELCPNDSNLYGGRSRVLGLLGEQRRSLEALERAVQLDPHDPAAIRACARYYRISQDPQKSREYAERALALAPNDPQCHLVLADALGEVAVGDPRPRVNAAAALEHFARALELAPNSHEAFYARGRFYYCNRDFQLALADLNRALELKPEAVAALRWRGKVFTRLGEYDKAMADLALLSKFQPHRWDVQRDIGVIHLETENWTAALDALNKAVEWNPASSFLLKLRARAHVNLKQYAPALADLSTALEREPRDTTALCGEAAQQLANAPEEFRQGLLELAAKAVQWSPDPACARRHRAALYRHMGLSDEVSEQEKSQAESGKQK